MGTSEIPALFVLTGAKSFSASLSWGMSPTLPSHIQGHGKQPAFCRNWKRSHLCPTELWTDVKAQRTWRPLRRSLSSSCGGSFQRCVAASNDADLHQSLEAAPQRQMLYEMKERSQGGKLCTISDTVMWPLRGTQHMHRECIESRVCFGRRQQ